MTEFEKFVFGRDQSCKNNNDAVAKIADMGLYSYLVMHQRNKSIQQEQPCYLDHLGFEAECMRWLLAAGCGLWSVVCGQLIDQE